MAAPISQNVVSGTNDPFPAAYAENPVEGEFLTFEISLPQAATIVGVTDTLGNTWERAARGERAAASIAVEIWYCVACVGSGANTVSINLTSSSACRVLLQRWAARVVSPLDGTPGTSSYGPGKSHPTGSTTPTQTGDLAICIWRLQGGGTSTGPSGFTQITSGSAYTLGYYKDLTTADAVNPVLATAADDYSAAAIALFKSEEGEPPAGGNTGAAGKSLATLGVG